MNIQLIRNATVRIEFASKTFLIDPFLAEKGAYPPFPNSVRQEQNNPLNELPLSIEEIITGVDAVILTHLHLDHYDEAAKKALPKNKKLFVQNEEDRLTIEQDGFTNVEVLTETSTFENISLIKTKGEHGRGEILKMTGEVSGVVFKHESERTLYVAGDTVWYEEIKQTIHTHTPSVIIANAGDNQFLEGGSLVMGKEDILALHRATSESTLIAVHMEAVNHWTLSREDLVLYAKEHGFSNQLIVPEDGQLIPSL
ncbi:MBL fold metallo-hydrolase [Exiguobacterium sp. SL14]|nr:MBL fold metallo-hydrolase [Exiguobacterium sp. SL14]MCY1691415.1 MBL fold metallo-hydrolase [Exiguobacterium sp. SL14]